MANTVRVQFAYLVPASKAFALDVTGTTAGDKGWIDVPAPEGTIGAMYVGAGTNGRALYRDNDGSNVVTLQSGLQAGSLAYFNPVTNVLRLSAVQDL